MSTDGAAPIALEPFAGVAAELEAGRASSEVLEREGITPERWKAAELYWKPRLDEGSGASDLEARTRYRALFAAKHRVALKRLERERARASRARPEPPDLRAMDAASAVFDEPLRAELPPLDAPAPPAVGRRAEVARATYEQASSSAAPSKVVAPAPSFGGFAAPPPSPAPPPEVSPRPRPASSPPTMALPPEALAPPQAPARSPRRSPTLAIALDAVPGAAVPFKPADPKAPPAPPPPVRITEASRPKRDLGATMMPDTEPAPRPATPFAATARKQDLGATMMPDTEPAPRPATPFVATARKQDLGATMMPDTEPAPRAATPFTPASRSPTPFPSTPAANAAPKRFAINVFASITAEIAEHPEDVAAIRARYGISEAEHRAESERWTDEFAKNDEIRQRYLGIVSRYRSYLQQRKKG